VTLNLSNDCQAVNAAGLTGAKLFDFFHAITSELF